MSDQKIAEFRELAERGLHLPDLAVIERRGHALRHRRVAVAAGCLAVALLAGGGIAKIATDDTDATHVPTTRPSPAPSSPMAKDVRTSINRGESVLLPGPSAVTYDGIEVSFDVPGKNWEWWDVGMGLRRAADDPDNYGAAVFFLLNATARLQPCSSDQVQALGSDPDGLIANVAPLLDLAHATVLEGPRVVTALGGHAVHLRLQTQGTCPGAGLSRPMQLRGQVDVGGAAADPGWDGRHQLDLWHVVLPGPEPTSMLVASWDLDGTNRHHAQQQALIDSLRIGPS